MVSLRSQNPRAFHTRLRELVPVILAMGCEFKTFSGFTLASTPAVERLGRQSTLKGQPSQRAWCQ
ncbi:MAG TPA: hypothetical protein VIX37_21595 [Candidatus Sulfotelmatobacter sp.]